VSGEGALGLGIAPDGLESEAHELGSGSLGALGLLCSGGSDGRLHDGRAVVGGARHEGDSRGFIGHPVEAGSQVTRDGLGAVGAHRSGLIYFALKSHAVTR
jgi:hypothetical protein